MLKRSSGHTYFVCGRWYFVFCVCVCVCGGGGGPRVSDRPTYREHPFEQGKGRVLDGHLLGRDGLVEARVQHLLAEAARPPCSCCCRGLEPGLGAAA